MSDQKEKAEMFKERARLVRDAFLQGMTLDALVALMRSRSTASHGLTSLYFAGADGDHPYFLRTDKVAFGLSVLPEDEWRSSREKLHPHQHEVIFVLEGSLCAEVLRNGRWEATDLMEGQVKIFYPNECHRIISGGKRAVFLFVKTRPAEEPRELDCSQRG